jgi:hypothetical protein
VHGARKGCASALCITPCINYAALVEFEVTVADSARRAVVLVPMRAGWPGSRTVVCSSLVLLIDASSVNSAQLCLEI